MKFPNFMFLIFIIFYLNENSLQPKNSTSEVQNQIQELTTDLKNFNKRLKNIIGPESEQQIAASKKKRMERQKEGERRFKERRTSSGGGFYPSSSRGSSRSYGDYGYEGGYTPSSHAKPYSGGGFDSKSSSSTWPSDFEFDKSNKEQKIGESTESSKNNFEKNLSNKSEKNQKEDKEDKHKGGIIDSRLKKDEKSVINKITNNTDEIKNNLKQLLTRLDEVHPTTQETTEARNKIYSDFLTEDDTLSELKESLGKRNEAIKSLSKELAAKHAAINQGEKQLWSRFLPHLIRMLVFVPESDELEAVSPAKAKEIKTLIRNLEKDKIISPNSVKIDQEKVESEVVNRLSKLKSTASKSEENAETINAIEQAVRHNFARPAEHADLKNLIKQHKKTIPKPVSTKE